MFRKGKESQKVDSLGNILPIIIELQQCFNSTKVNAALGQSKISLNLRSSIFRGFLYLNLIFRLQAPGCINFTELMA